MEKIKVLAEVKVKEEATPEELCALKKLLEKAGLIVEADGRELLISVEDRDD